MSIRNVFKLLLSILAVVAVPGFIVAFIAISLTLFFGTYLGGSAYSGFVRDGHYFVAAKGMTHEVSRFAFRSLSAIEWTAIGSAVVVIVGVLSGVLLKLTKVK